MHSDFREQKFEMTSKNRKSCIHFFYKINHKLTVYKNPMRRVGILMVTLWEKKNPVTAALS